MKKSVSLCLVFFILVGILSGCGINNTSSSTEIKSGADFSYPIETDETLQYWYIDYTAGKVNRQEAPLHQAFEKNTGVKLEYIPVSSSVATEQFNLLLASGNLPDIISYDWLKISGGPQKAVDGGHIMKLNELLENHMPNLSALFEAKPEYEKQVRSDNGDICIVPSYRGAEELLTYCGPIIRKDWLDDLGLEVPETLDEWYTALTAFKNEKGASGAFACLPEFLLLFISGAYPVSMTNYSEDFYVDDNGEIVYGPIQPHMKDALKVFNKWYKEGLIDANIASLDANALNSKMTTGQAGASIGLNGGALGKWLTAMQSVDEKYNLVGTKYPVVNKGDKPFMGQMDNDIMPSGQAISAKTKNPELCARYLDYFFSEEGISLFNYGEEGVAHDVVNGEKIFKEEVLKSGDLAKYADIGGGQSVQQWDAYKQNLVFENQREAVENWRYTDAQKHIIPAVNYTSDESAEISKLMSDIETFKDEKFFQFMFGFEDIDAGFDAYVEQIKAMGIDKVAQHKKAAVERYNNR